MFAYVGLSQNLEDLKDLLPEHGLLPYTGHLTVVLPNWAVTPLHRLKQGVSVRSGVRMTVYRGSSLIRSTHPPRIIIGP